MNNNDDIKRDHEFTVIFSKEFYGEIYHDTTINLCTIMPHMAAAMIAAGLSAFWGDSAITETFIPVLQSGEHVKLDRYMPNRDEAASANALLDCVNEIAEYYDREYEENTNFRNQVTTLLKRVLPARLGY